MTVSNRRKTGEIRLAKRWGLWFAVGAALPYTAGATGRIWIADTSNWNTATNWFALPGGGSGVPVSGDDAYLTQADTTDRVVNFDGNYISPSLLASLTIDATSLGTMTLSQTAANRFRADSQYIGDAGRGTYSQSSGTNDANTLYLGFSAAGNGTYSMTGAANLNINAALYIGYSGTGTINQSSGTVAVSAGAEMVLGYIAGSSGNYNLSGGTITTPGLRIGDDALASGQFVHSGGTATTVTVTNDVELATTSTSSVGSYSISGGKLVVGRSLMIGKVGTGVFTQTGGIVQVNGGGTNGVFLGGTANSGPLSQGTYNLSGSSTLSINGNLYVGYAGNGAFTQSGGTNTITGSLALASTSGTSVASADYFLQGGTLKVLGAGVVQLNTGGGFTQTGGTLTYTAFNMDGGAVNGTLTNSGTFNYNAGTFNGRLSNSALGLVNFNADFVAGNGILNAGFLDIPANRTVTLNGSGLSNNGTLRFAGGLLTGPGPFQGSGQIAGFGTVSGSGGFAFGGGSVGPGNFYLSNTGANQVNGILSIEASVTGNSFVLDGSSISMTNFGIITLHDNGSITGAGNLDNKGTITTGPGAIIDVSFTNHGQIELGNDGNAGDLSVTQPFINFKTINLNNYSMGGAAISNSGFLGFIRGPGQIDNDIDNSGTIDLAAAGTLSLTGTVSTQAASVIKVMTGGTIIASNLLNNAGAIQIASGGTFTAGSFANLGSISNAGTLNVDGISNTGSINYGNAASIDSFGQITNLPGGTIAVDSAGSPTVVFYDDIQHNPGASLTIGSGATAVFLGNIAGGGNVANTGTMNLGADKTFVIGELSGPGSTLVYEGAALTAKRITQGSLGINTVAAHVGSVKITPAATAGTSTSKVNLLDIAGGAAPTAQLDLSNTNLVIDYTGGSPIALVRSQIKAAFNSGTWNGNGITSSSAAGDGKTALGYAEASVALALSGSNTANWFGQTVDATSILIRYTKAGDADLDGSVGFSDLVAVAQHYGDSSGNRIWYEGDFNYDGIVDFSDLVVVAQNYGTALPSLPVGAAYPNGFAAAYTAAAGAVPEPGSLWLAALGAGGSILTSARSRKRRKIAVDSNALLRR